MLLEFFSLTKFNLSQLNFYYDLFLFQEMRRRRTEVTVELRKVRADSAPFFFTYIWMHPSSKFVQVVGRDPGLQIRMCNL